STVARAITRSGHWSSAMCGSRSRSLAICGPSSPLATSASALSDRIGWALRGRKGRALHDRADRLLGAHDARRDPKSGDRMLVDWTGSSPQVKGAINNTLSFTKSASYCAIRSILPGDIPNNEGVFRAIEVTAPPATIANGVLPAACAAR